MQLAVFFDTVSEESLNDEDLSKAFFAHFLTYTLRFIILLKSLSFSRDLPDDVVYSLASFVKLIQNKFANYVEAFPENRALFEAIEKPELQHEGACHVKEFYKPATKENWGKIEPKKTSSFEVQPRSAGTQCSYCLKEQKELKVCSRCRQAYYCDPSCQKNHYPAHKASCLQHSQNTMIAKELSTQSKDY